MTSERATTTVLPVTDATPNYILSPEQKSYRHQYSNIYFIRLRLLRDAVEGVATQRWSTGPDPPSLVPNVLEIVKSQICYVVGTVYMDMPLKPNVLDDIARDQSIPAPPPPTKFISPDDIVTLEDESGRIKLVGPYITTARLVTGVVIGVLGMETPEGAFEVVDICYGGMAPQTISDPPAPLKEERMDVDGEDSTLDDNTRDDDEWIAVVSGLEIGSPSPSDAQLDLLVEYLTGESGPQKHQVAASRISRLIIAGNSLSPVIVSTDDAVPDPDDKKARKYGQDTTTFSTHPTIVLSDHLYDIGQTMPIHILPGDTDPARIILPQQPFPRGMFGAISSSPSFTCETNPTYLRICSGIVSDPEELDRTPRVVRNLLINSGQPLNDMFKYLTAPHTRLEVMESTLKWRHMAPTAPDTLWCHPYLEQDPFIIRETPDIYLIGGQKKFATKMATEDGLDGTKKRCRLVLIPRFSTTGVVVLVNLRTLQVKTTTLALYGMTGDGKDSGDTRMAGVPVAQSASMDPSAASIPTGSLVSSGDMP